MCTLKKAECRRIDASELWCWRRLLRVPWTARRSNQSILKEISPGISLEGMMLKLKTPVLWPPREKSWLIGKDPDVARDWGQEEKGTTEDEMAGWHHWLDGRESEWTPGVGDGQGGLACCDAWGRKELHMTERLNWTEQLKGTCVEQVNFFILKNQGNHHLASFLGIRLFCGIWEWTTSWYSHCQQVEAWFPEADATLYAASGLTYRFMFPCMYHQSI